MIDISGAIGSRPWTLSGQRYDDTVELLQVMLHDGVRTGRGRAAVEHLNGIHGHYRISDDDFRYTLTTFVVVPVRWIQRFGWRGLHDNEIRALTLAVADMGHAMHISGIPDSYPGFAEFFDAYERTHFAYDESGHQVAMAMIELVRSWMPFGAKSLARLVVLAVLEPSLATALGLPALSRSVRAVASGALRARAALLGQWPARRQSRPKVLHSRTYPYGVAISDVGPTKLR